MFKPIQKYILITICFTRKFCVCSIFSHNVTNEKRIKMCFHSFFENVLNIYLLFRKRFRFISFHTRKDFLESAFVCFDFIPKIELNFFLWRFILCVSPFISFFSELYSFASRLFLIVQPETNSYTTFSFHFFLSIKPLYSWLFELFLAFILHFTILNQLFDVISFIFDSQFFIECQIYFYLIFNLTQSLQFIYSDNCRLCNMPNRTKKEKRKENGTKV